MVGPPPGLPIQSLYVCVRNNVSKGLSRDLQE